MISIQPVIVIYNTYAGDSVSVISMIEQNARPIIIDNSTSDYNNQNYCEKNGLTYVSMNGNAGLSKAYNRAVSIINDDVDYILWLDDDTIIPNDYIMSASRIIEEQKEYDVYIPTIKSVQDDSKFLSPCLLKKNMAYKLDNLDNLKDGQFSAINSGMIVKRSLYNQYKYNEDIFLDCLDHDFMCDCWENNKKVFLMRSLVLKQNFSGETKETKKNKFIRLKIYKKDFITFRKKHKSSAMLTKLYIIKRIISIMVK